MTAARFVWVFGSDALIAGLRALGLRRYAPLGPRRAAVLGWAGMRGVVTLAVALSVPEDFPGRDFILVTAFAVILGTVLIQGTTLGGADPLGGSERDRGRPGATDHEPGRSRDGAGAGRGWSSAAPMTRTAR